MRVFIAIDFPEEVREEILKIQNQLSFSKGKLTEPENLHLTLKFLGNVRDKQIEEIQSRLNKIKYERFETEVKYAGFFDNQEYRVIWLYLTNCENLQKKIDETLSELFEKEKRFQSHLTIARVKPPYDAKYIQNELRKLKISPIKFVVDNFRLKESNLHPDGPKYKTIEEYNLS
jgi:RNA 2',3'-cyclic 3'-phosphodiesterase